MAKHSWKSSFVDSKIAGLYDLGETLGKGHFAVVKTAKHVFTGERVAVKVIDKTKLDEVSREHLMKEVRCMKLVQHPNVVKLYEVIDTKTKLYLILELGDGGDMYDYIMDHERGLTEDKARYFFRQIVLAIDYCHKLHVVHRDLKPENVIFFKNQDLAKLTDFGFSNNFIPNQKLETACGSLAYSAPEVLLGDAYEAPAVDVWSLGVILFMLVSGQAPFNETNDSETLTKIMDCRYQVPAHVSSLCKSLISRMLIREPHHRACLEEIINHPWLQHGTTPLVPYDAPLVADLPLSPEEHLLLIDKMESGNMASREQILRSLREDPYDHTAATYFLLAEQYLRRLKATSGIDNSNVVAKKKRRSRGPLPENILRSPRKSPSRPSSAESDSGSEKSSDNSPRTSARRLVPREGQIMNKILQAHAVEVDEALHSSIEEDDSNLVESHRIFHSLDDFSSKPSSSHRSLYSSPDDRPSLAPSRPRHRRAINAHLPLAKAKSTPMHLNQIFEERESDLEDSPMNSPRLERARKHPGGGAIKSKRNQRRLSPVTSSGSRRSSSCSSSDDDDLDKHMKRLNTSSSCRRSPRQYRRDDSGSEGDGGLDGGTNGATRMAGIGHLHHGSSTQTTNDSNDSKDSTQKQTGGGKTNSSSRNNFLLACENKCFLASIDESNKENMSGDSLGNECCLNSYNTLLKENSFGNTPNMEQSDEPKPPKKEHGGRANSAPLPPAKTNVEHTGRSSSFISEHKGSAAKYIYSFCELERRLETNGGDHVPSSGGKRDSLKQTDFENIDVTVDIKRQRTLHSDNSHLKVLRNATVKSVTSACCQIF